MVPLASASKNCLPRLHPLATWCQASGLAYEKCQGPWDSYSVYESAQRRKLREGWALLLSPLCSLCLPHPSSQGLYKVRPCAFQLPQPGPGQSRHLPALKGDCTPASLSWSLEGPSVQRGKDRSFQDQQLWKFWKLRCNVALELGR